MRKVKKQQKKSNKEIHIIITAAVAFLLELCTLNVLGKIGGWVRYALFGLFGLMAYVFPLIGALAVIYCILQKEKRTSKLVCGIIFFVCLCAFVHMISFKGFLDAGILSYFTDCARNGIGGGIIGGLFSFALAKAVGIVGAYIIVILAMIICLLIICEIPLLASIKSLFTRVRTREKDYDDYDEDEDDEEEEDEEQPDKVVVPRSRFLSRRQEEETVYETQSEEGVTIRIVHAPGKGRQRAAIRRSEKKAVPLRNGSVQTKRTQAKAKGIADVGTFKPIAPEDEVREITHARPVRPEIEEEIISKPIQVTEVMEDEEPGEAPEAFPLGKGPKTQTGRTGKKPGSCWKRSD